MAQVVVVYSRAHVFPAFTVKYAEVVASIQWIACQFVPHFGPFWVINVQIFHSLPPVATKLLYLFWIINFICQQKLSTICFIIENLLINVISVIRFAAFFAQFSTRIPKFSPRFMLFTFRKLLGFARVKVF